MPSPAIARRPRILVVNKLYPPFVGGVEKVAADIVDELSDRYDFHVLACQAKGRRVVEKQGNVTVERCASWGVLRSVPISFDFVRRYRQLAPQFDLVHFHEPFPLGTLGGAVSGFKRGVITFHSQVLRQRILKHAYTLLLKSLLRKVDAIMPTSPDLFKHAKILQPYRDKIHSVPLGIDASYLEVAADQTEEIQKVRDRITSDFMYLAVGRCVGYKGFGVLLEAFSKIPAGNLVIVGDGPLRSELGQKAMDYGIADRVLFTGKISDRELAHFFHACDVFVLPSTMETEAFGLVQLEAMACGKPVINTNLKTGVPYVSLDGETGITVPVGEPVPLANAMQQMQDNPQMRSLFGKNARLRFQNNFRRSHMASKVDNVYRHVLGEEMIPSQPTMPTRQAA